MSFSLLSLWPVFLQIAVLAALLALSVRLIRRSGQAVAAVFLTFVFALWLFTDLYWVIFDLMRPDGRMPFAANEIGEAAVFLMLAALLSSFSLGRGRVFCWQTAGALAFALGNAALWVAWSREWIDDLFIGAAYAAFLAQVVRALMLQGSLRTGEWIALAAGCFLLLLGQALTFFVPEGAVRALELGCYLLLAAGAVCWAIKAFSARRGRPLYLIYALLGWVITAKYMSAGDWYSLFLVCETLCLPPLYRAVRREVRA